MTSVIRSVSDSVMEFSEHECESGSQTERDPEMRYLAVLTLLAAAMSAQNAPSTNRRRHLDIPAISVVSIIMSDKEGHPVAQGSGFLISKDGWIVTNYHVIKTGNSAIAKLPNGTLFAVDGVVASDKGRDVAIIKAHGDDFSTLALGDSARLQVGEEVVVIGNPLSLESTVSNGIVSAVRTVEERGGEFLQITAPISPGSSGGPLFNMAGEVVGITSAGIKGGENLNFAIPIDDVKPMISGVSKMRTGVGTLPDEAEPDEAEPVTAAPTQGQRSFEELVSHKDKSIVHELDADVAYVCFPRPERANDEFFIASYEEPKENGWVNNSEVANTVFQKAAASFVFYVNGQNDGHGAYAVNVDELTSSADCAKCSSARSKSRATALRSNRCRASPYPRETGAHTPTATRRSGAAPRRKSCQRRARTCPIRRAR